MKLNVCMANSQRQQRVCGAFPLLEQPWKSGASTAALRAHRGTAFKPCAPPRLKPAIRMSQRGAKAPLFHGSFKFITIIVLLSLHGIFANPAHAQVTFDRLLNSSKEPQNWMTYSGDYTGRRFSALDQINVTNAHSMTAKWVYQTGATGKLEALSRACRLLRFGRPTSRSWNERS